MVSEPGSFSQTEMNAENGTGDAQVKPERLLGVASERGGKQPHAFSKKSHSDERDTRGEHDPRRPPRPTRRREHSRAATSPTSNSSQTSTTRDRVALAGETETVGVECRRQLGRRERPLDERRGDDEPAARPAAADPR